MKRLFQLSMLILLVSACQTDSYEKGTGRYSLMQADLAELYTDAEKQGVAFVTDDGIDYTLSAPVTARWLNTPDSVYRALVYYNKEEDGRAQLMGLGAVPTLLPVEHWKIEQPREDPVDIESAWLSKSGKYLNLALLFKSGRVDDEEGIHTIGLAQDTILTHPNQTRTAYYRLLHDQGDTPEYYTNRHYVSILLPTDRPDTVLLSINTYKQVSQLKFCLTGNN